MEKQGQQPDKYSEEFTRTFQFPPPWWFRQGQSRVQPGDVSEKDLSQVPGFVWQKETPGSEAEGFISTLADCL